jgi:intraflagellar transport protein 140
MKVLVKSGDTDRILFYANVARHRDIYMLAANYLQIGTDWQNSPNLQEQIVNFYAKAKSPESIISFYEAWAQTNFEVEKNYEKSLGNLRKAEAALMEIIQHNPDVKAYETRMVSLQTKIQNVDRFLTLRGYAFQFCAFKGPKCIPITIICYFSGY